LIVGRANPDALFAQLSEERPGEDNVVADELECELIEESGEGDLPPTPLRDLSSSATSTPETEGEVCFGVVSIDPASVRSSGVEGATKLAGEGDPEEFHPFLGTGVAGEVTKSALALVSTSTGPLTIVA
jgi:hypothetical protein